MTLDELLAFLPDNQTGQISAADLRAIVTDLFNAAHLVGGSFAYQWSTSGGAPGTGKITTDQPWQLTATKVLVSETAADGMAVTFSVVDSSGSGRVWMATADGAKLTADITGPSVDQGTYREVPITALSLAGTPPSNNENVTVTFGAIVA